MKKEEANTFMGWVNKGRGVKVGEKAAYYDEDVVNGVRAARAMFLKSQTKKLLRVYRNPTAEVRGYWKRDGGIGSGTGISDTSSISEVARYDRSRGNTGGVWNLCWLLHRSHTAVVSGYRVAPPGCREVLRVQN